jgi:microsomal dipeptidase-like Zn-dependent dipeptidase
MIKSLLSLFIFISFCTSLHAQEFQHVSAANNLESGWTYLDHPQLNNNPQAIIYAELISGPSKGKNLGVWYNASKARWAIFHQDRTAMQVGNVFRVNTQAQFVHKAARGNTDNYLTTIDHPQLNNNPNAKFVVTPNWNPNGQGGLYDDHAITIVYKGDRWMIVHTDQTPIPEGAAFNIFITPAKTAAITTIPDNKVSLPANGSIDQKTVQNVPQQNNATIAQIAVDPATISVIVADANLNFENRLSRWKANGSAFANQPVEGSTLPSERVLNRMDYRSGGIGGDYWKGLPYSIGVKDNFWIGTYEKGNGDAPTGTLMSSPLKVANRYLHFLLGGGKDLNNLYVELQVKLTDYQAAWGAGKTGFFGVTDDGFTRVNRVTPLINSEELFRYWFDLDAELNHQYANKTVRVCIVDNSSRPWGHINVDDIGFTDNLSNFISLRRDGFGLYADVDKPVWGYFDSHAHPAADEAFGKNYYVGSSLTPLSTTWSNEVCTRSHTWGRTLDGFTNIFDPHKFFDGGWPDIWGYPRFNGKMHQKYQVDLIRRAWQGGLKIFCALGINNMYIATRALGHNTNGEAIDDESVLLRQIAVVKEMARANSDWMEIAYTPRDARRIVLEGKLCVILGAETDVFGNFKSPDCTWSNRDEDRPLVTITEADANDKLERKLNEYYALGLRQVTPLHYLSKPFGGTAVFNGNTFLPQISFYDHVRVKTGIPDRIGFSLYEDFPTGPALVGNLMTYAAYAARVWKQDEGTETSMVNADGLTATGTVLFRKLMRKGFIVDQEHASYQSKRDILNIASQNGNYPVIASHCTPEGLSFIWSGAPVRFGGNNQDKIRNFNTSTIRYVSHEMELNDESYTGIKNTEGTVGVFALLNHKQKYNGSWGDIPNDCPGSTKSMAQMYCYSLDKMNGHGVGLSSDLPMVDAVAPRFGPFAAWALTTEEDDLLKKTQRTSNRMAQRNGVRYDVPSRSYHPDLFKDGQIDVFEEDVWKALAAWEAGIDAVGNESLVAESSDPEHRGRIRNMVKGLDYTNQNQLLRCIVCGDAPREQAAMFCLRNNISPESLTGFDAGGIRDAANIYNKILPIWNLWKEKSGNNEPLRRCITGNRYWDFNLDGLAHYGLMPDLLQDLKNIGFTDRQLVPLFASAEDYIRMWEKAEAAKNNVRD